MAVFCVLTWEGVDGVKLEADSILRQFKSCDAHLGEEVVQVFCNLREGGAAEGRSEKKEKKGEGM